MCIDFLYFISLMILHLLLQCFHFLEICNLILELEVIFAMLFDSYEFDKECDPDKYGKNRKNLIPRTHEEIIDCMQKYRQTKTCQEVLDRVIF